MKEITVNYKGINILKEKALELFKMKNSKIVGKKIV